MDGRRVLSFTDTLRRWPSREGVFNPWAEVDPEHDLGPHCPQVRRAQLDHYLSSRLGTARYLLVGEALGYQGGHFSGIAMTSERMLLGELVDRGIHPQGILPGLSPRRTSKPALKARGFSEPTATIVWGTLLAAGLAARAFVCWNAFAWHPYDLGRGMLSNRRPQQGELRAGAEVLRAFLGLFPQAQPLAVGRVAAELLARLDVGCHPLRHPAQGGARLFRRQIRDLLVGETSR